MFIYYAMFLVWAAGAVQFSSGKKYRFEPILYIGAVSLLVLIMGVRYEVGGDYETYLHMYNDMYFLSFTDALRYTDLGYATISWVARQAGLGLWVVNTVCAALFASGLARLANQQYNRWLAFVVATPYLVIVVGMGYTRQAAAIGIICWTIAGIEKINIKAVLFGIAFASLFHKTAILTLPIILLPLFVRNPLYAIIGLILTLAIAIPLLGDSSRDLVTNYVNSDYQSSGAAIRVAMNTVAALVFFIMRKRMRRSTSIYKIWRNFAVIATLAPLGLVSARSSVGIDRLSLYLIPLQVVVFSQMPYILRGKKEFNRIAILAVIGYSFAVEWAYFNFASFSWAWVPYQNIITSDLSQHRLSGL